MIILEEEKTLADLDDKEQEEASDIIEKAEKRRDAEFQRKALASLEQISEKLDRLLTRAQS